MDSPHTLCHEMNRREFLTQSSLGLIGLGISRLNLPPAGVPFLQAAGATRKKVLVLGAGLAGLVAAYELVQAGHDVTVVEASTRSGGRVWTLREPFSDGLYAEAGAGRIPNHHDITLRYVKQFGLPLDAFYPSAGASLYCIRGKRIPVRPGENLDLSQLPFDLTPEERRLGLDGLEQKFVDPVLKDLGNPGDPDWPPETLTKYDRITWADFLRSQGASAGAVQLLTSLSGWQDDSALDFLRDDLGHRGAKSLFKIRGGNDLLPKAFAAQLAERIRYGSQVTSIAHDTSHVRALCVEAGSQVFHHADYMICAIPFSCLRRVEIWPSFRPEKQTAIQQLSYDPVVRIFFQTRRRFWADEGLNGFADTDDPMEIWNPTFDQPAPGASGRGILMAYIEDGLTRRITAQPDTERIRFGIAAVERAHPRLREFLEAVTPFSWADQPWARGAYTYFTPGQITAWNALIRQPEGRIHFAGEHASSWPGWMQGALESGLRAAREVHQAP